MTSDVRTPLDQEDRRPSPALAVNVLQVTRDAQALLIGESTKLSNKRCCSPWNSDDQKIESMCSTIDCIETLFTLTEDL